MDNLTEKQVFVLIESGQFQFSDFEDWVDMVGALAFENGCGYIESLCDAKELDD